jgi:hypothetical protein
MTGHSFFHPGPPFPRKGKLEGSNNKQTWVLIDEQENSQIFFSFPPNQTIPVKGENLFRIYRFTLIDESQTVRNNLVNVDFDFFGI